VEYTVEGNDYAQKLAIYAPVWWGETAVAYQAGIKVENYNSFTLTSQNWPSLFSYSAA